MSLALDMSLRHALSKKFQAALGQVDNLTLILVLEFVVGFDLAVCNRPDMFNDILRLANETDQGLILRLKQL